MTKLMGWAAAAIAMMWGLSPVTARASEASQVLSRPLDPIIAEIRSIQARQVPSMGTLHFLMSADAQQEKVGYGLCRAAGYTTCEPDASVGYGICRAAGSLSCESDGSLGYGLCKAANNITCDPRGSVGYGICKAAGVITCPSRASIGYALCRASGGLTCHVD
jgi:hypothetical protein